MEMVESSKRPLSIKRYLLLSLLVLVMGGCTFMLTCQPWWDHRVNELCKKDGGAVVFERIAVGETEWDEGVFYSSHLSKSNKTPYRFEESETLLNSYPKVVRYEWSYFRSSSGKLIGTVVNYVRSGGDLPLTSGNDSQYSCGAAMQERFVSERAIFVRGKYVPELE